MRWLEERVEAWTRGMANRASRRDFLTRVGRWLVGASTLPLLPVSRVAARPGTPEDPGDPTQCDYWRYCAIDGYLCSCCGGTPSTCPPGTVPSPTAWVGTCRNPADGKDYIIEYRDCCGKDSCGRCACLGLEGEQPVYRPQLNNDIVWCLGSPSMVYHCSGAVVLGVAERAS